MTKTKTKIRLVRRDDCSGYIKLINVVLFIILALAFCSIFMLAQGHNPVEVYAKMFSSAFGSWKGLSKSITTGVPLMICGLAVSVAFKMNLNNIGAEGQYAMGAIVSGGFILFGPQLPAALQIPVMIILAILGGAVWALIAAIPKALWGVNETIVTLMLNYVALLLLDYLCYGPWKDAGGLNLPYTANIPDTARLPYMFNDSVSSAFIVAVVVAIIMYLFFKYTTTGYQVNIIKHSLTAAKYAGINVKSKIITVLAISGGLAGLTGATQVSSVLYRLQPQIPGGAGFTAIVIAYLSKFNPIIVIIVSIFFGGLEKGAYAVQTKGVPSQVATMIQGAILIFVLAGEFFNNYKFKKMTVHETEETK